MLWHTHIHTCTLSRGRWFDACEAVCVCVCVIPSHTAAESTACIADTNQSKTCYPVQYSPHSFILQTYCITDAPAMPARRTHARDPSCQLGHRRLIDALWTCSRPAGESLNTGAKAAAVKCAVFRVIRDYRMGYSRYRGHAWGQWKVSFCTSVCFEHQNH